MKKFFRFEVKETSEIVVMLLLLAVMVGIVVMLLLSFSPQTNTEAPAEVCIEERLVGFYALNLEQSVEYNENLIKRVFDYSIRHQDIGVFPIVEESRVTGFVVYATKIGAGHTRMNEEILNLVNPD